MQNIPMLLRASPGGRVAFRVSECEDHEKPWREFYWSQIQKSLAIRGFSDDFISGGWDLVCTETGPGRRLLDGVIVNATEGKIATRIPEFVERNDNFHWLSWHLSEERGLTVELLTDDEIDGWTSVYAEEVPPESGD